MAVLTLGPGAWTQWPHLRDLTHHPLDPHPLLPDACTPDSCRPMYHPG
jgi:hypothetical protein